MAGTSRRAPRVIVDQESGTAMIELIRRGRDSAWTTIDLDDLALVSEYRWYEARRPNGQSSYVEASLPRSQGRRVNVLMHRLLMGFPEGRHVDHRDGNGMDNRRSNLRVATYSQNRYNEITRRGGTSQFKGVSWSDAAKGWVARAAEASGAYVHLGVFDDQVSAAVAFDISAFRERGEFANTNFTREFVGAFGTPRRRVRPELPHGRTMYTNHGCRCDVCRSGEREYSRRRRAARGNLRVDQVGESGRVSMKGDV